MGETANIADIAQKLSKDIFKHFGWHIHPRKDDNFDCINDDHEGASGSATKTHPTDVVFSYDDPYLAKRVHLLTDLKSYAKSSITHHKIRTALKSLALTVDCAGQSVQWSEKFSVITSDPHEVRGLLFVHNHDNGYEKSFYDEMARVNTKTLPIEGGGVLHYLGPHDIQRLYTISNDILRLKAEQELPDKYTFYYPDLVMRRRHGDVWEQSATFEMLAGPFMTIKHKAFENRPAGYVIYYNRPGASPEEFEYLLDCFSRFQMLESDELLRIRVVDRSADEDLKSRFDLATKKYAKAWGFDPAREKVLSRIEIERVVAVTNNYSPGDMGWRT